MDPRFQIEQKAERLAGDLNTGNERDASNMLRAEFMYNPQEAMAVIGRANQLKNPMSVEAVVPNQNGVEGIMDRRNPNFFDAVGRNPYLTFQNFPNQNYANQGFPIQNYAPGQYPPGTYNPGIANQPCDTVGMQPIYGQQPAVVENNGTNPGAAIGGAALGGFLGALLGSSIGAHNRGYGPVYMSPPPFIPHRHR